MEAPQAVYALSISVEQKLLKLFHTPSVDTPSRLVATHSSVVSLCECHCRIECLVSVLAWNLGNLLVGVGGWRVSCFSKVYIRMINFQGTGSRVLSHFAGEGIGWREKNYFRRCDTTRIHHRDSRSPAQLFIFILFITFRE